MRKDLIEAYFAVSTQMQRAWKSCVLSEIAEENISIAQMGLLFLLNEHQPVLSKDIATKMHITRSAVAQLVEGLDELGYITRTEDESDRRMVYIRLSTRGQKKLGELEDRRRRIFESLVSDLSDEQLQEAIKINQVMLQQLEK